MADVSQLPKRQREDSETSLQEQEDGEYSAKRQKTYTQILSILDEDEEELNQDYLTDIFSTLHQELSSSKSSINSDNNLSQNNDVQENDHISRDDLLTSENRVPLSFFGTSSVTQNSKVENEEEEDCNNVMRHLLEASDDELGLPNIGNDGSDDGVTNGGDLPFPVNVGLWEIEDEAANYYAILQSELFM